MSKIIGFVDYYISEWHANNYPAWLKEMCEKHGYDYQVKYVWAEQYVSPVDGRNTDEWCKEFGTEKCETIAELCEKCDNIIVLAPSNPEKHLRYAKEVLKYKKNTYIDKTFSPNYAEAEEMFSIAEKYGTKFFSTSALRYAEELRSFDGCGNVMTFGGGGSLEEYIVHQIEMVESIVNLEPESAQVDNQGTQYICKVVFKNGTTAKMIFAPALSFAVCADNAEGNPVYKPVTSSFFKNLMADILKFFETGEYPFDTKQTLYAMKMRELVLRSAGIIK